MQDNLIWQQNSSASDNGENLTAIANWWSSLSGKEVLWQQRLISRTQELQELDWQPQKFDDKFVLSSPQLKGITLYWQSIADERNITPNKLQLNPSKNLLYVFPQSQSQIVIRIKLPETVYQKIELNYPKIAATLKDDTAIILLRDDTEKLEIKVTLDRAGWNQLKERLLQDNK